MKNIRYYILISFLTILLLLEAKSSSIQSLESEIIAKSGSANTTTTESIFKELYKDIDAASYDLSYEAFHYAMLGYIAMVENKALDNDEVITIIDFTKDSCKKRFYTIDLSEKKIVFNTLVSHGKKSGSNVCTKFSDIPESHQSSIGFYTTGNTYIGKHGKSLRLHGNERGYNANAYKRAVVIHGADYVSDNFIKSYGRLGRSFGCPALPMGEHKEIIRKIKGGSLIFAYYNDTEYLQNSQLLKEKDSKNLIATL
ncbi:murein L,D-transpeptidase catalytic domain family protein [Balneicella halophila]|nr:murein L,D-transpeptidase catalytic domain family protein [Balneicella halophila]